ncbi:MAG TPA: VWA domain-containing protein [Vicinamibacterales bacterium]|nr:VWA domain-containing protein [Vicinamibacterales bacterium]
MLRRLFLAVVASVSAVAALTGAPAQTQGTPQPTFRSGVDLVRFDVRVVDEAGRPITDLRPEEIEIREDGAPLPIVLFQRVTEPASSYVEEAIRATTAEVSSNAAFPRGHLYILIFDQQHITPGNEARARMAAEQFIRRRVRPSDRVALFGLPGPGPQLGFTADKMRAIKELATIRGMYERVPPNAFGNIPRYHAHRILQGDEKLIADTLQRMTLEGTADLLGFDPGGSNAPGGGRGRGGGAGAAEETQVIRRILQENVRTIVNQSDAESRQFLQRLADVIAGFRDIEGRKTVVLFSEGFIQDNLVRELENVAAAAAQSYCVFVSMDLNQRHSSTDAHVQETTLAEEIQARMAPLGTLAAETDGELVIDAAARAGEALDKLADQAQDYYLVGFTPSQQARLNRGKYRRVSVVVKRPGARVSARTGYTVAPDTAVTDRRRAIDMVLGAPFVQQGLKVDYTTYVMKGPDTAQQRVVLSLNADLPVRSEAADSADVVFVVRDVRDGRVAASGSDVIPLPSKPRAGSPLGTGTWRVQFTVPPGSYLMRTVVREPGGLTGSADRRLEVRPLDGPDVTVSDLVLGSAIGGLPVRARAYTGDGLVGVIETYARTPVQMERLDVQIELRDLAGRVVTAIQPELTPPDAAETGISRRAHIALPLTNVAPGDYTAHAIVRARGEIVGERTRQVEVLAGTAPAVTAETAAATAATWAPIEIVRGDLARRYIAWLSERAKGTPAAAAAAHAAANRWEQVEAEARRVADPANAAGHALLGLALFVREDYAGAAEALKRASDAAPDNALTAFFLGWALEGAGDKPGSIGAWRSAAHLDPAMVSAHLALADGYLRMGQPALAIQAVKAGLAAIPASHELQAKLQQLEKR